MNETKDCNGNVLKDGDNIQLIKDLQVKGSSLHLKSGHVIKKIRITDNPEEVEAKEGKTTIVLKTCFIKKRK